MSTQSISSARSFSPPSVSNKLLSSLRNPAALGEGAAKSLPTAVSSAPSPERNLVNLSSQGRALQQNDLQQQTNTLSALTRQSLSLLTPNADSATISFDQLTYSASSSASFLQSGNRTQFRSEQQSSLIGTGRITTTSGEEFEFTAELDVAQVLDVRQSTETTQTTPPPPNQAPNAADNVVQLRIPKLTDLLEASSRLLDLLQQTSLATAAKTSTAKPEQQTLAAPISRPSSSLDANLLRLLENLGGNTPSTEAINTVTNNVTNNNEKVAA